MKKKNTKQYFDGGNILSLLGGLSNVIPSDNTAGGAAGGAIKGASSMATTGNPYLIGAGALLGGINGGIQGYKQNMDNQINPFTDGVNQRNQMLNIMADGGLLTSFDGGYKHDEINSNNINGGIPQGIAPDGRMNTVENGETKMQDFVFSDSLKVPKNLDGTNLPKKLSGKTFAQASKVINDMMKDRPHDKITGDTSKLLLGQLKGLNTNLLMQNNTNKFDNGGPITIDPNVNVDSLNNVNYQRQQDHLKSQYGIDPQVEHYSFPNMEFYSRVPSQEEVARMDSAFQANLLNTNKLIDSLQNVVPEPIPYPKSPATTKQAVLDWIKNGKVGPMPRVGYKNGGSIEHQVNPWLDFSWNQPKPTEIPEVSVSAKSKNPVLTNNPINYFNYPNIFGNGMSSPDSTLTRRGFVENWDPYIQGSTLGQKGVPIQRIDANGTYAGKVSPRDIIDTDPEFIKSIFGDNFTGTPEQISILQRAIENTPERYSQVRLRPGATNAAGQDIYTPWGADWMNALKVGNDKVLPPREDLQRITSIIPTLQNIPLDDKLKPIPPKVPTTETPGTPGLDVPVPNLWPEAGLLQALPYLGLKPNLADPTLMSTGYLKPQLVDEMSMRAGIDQANRANTGALGSVTGGSASAQRAGLLGNGANYMNAINNAFIQSNQANNQARMAADQFNIQNQTGVAGQNMGALNQFELENKELINNINAKKADEFSNAWANYVENGYRRRAAGDLERARRNEIEAFTGYNIPSSQKTIQLIKPTQGTPPRELTWEEWYNSPNQKKLAKNVTFGCGGAIKRSLK